MTFIEERQKQIIEKLCTKQPLYPNEYEMLTKYQKTIINHFLSDIWPDRYLKQHNEFTDDIRNYTHGKPTDIIAKCSFSDTLVLYIEYIKAINNTIAENKKYFFDNPENNKFMRFTEPELFQFTNDIHTFIKRTDITGNMFKCMIGLINDRTTDPDIIDSVLRSIIPSIMAFKCVEHIIPKAIAMVHQLTICFNMVKQSISKMDKSMDAAFEITKVELYSRWIKELPESSKQKKDLLILGLLAAEFNALEHKRLEMQKRGENTDVLEKRIKTSAIKIYNIRLNTFKLYQSAHSLWDLIATSIKIGYFDEVNEIIRHNIDKLNMIRTMEFFKSINVAATIMAFINVNREPDVVIIIYNVFCNEINIRIAKIRGKYIVAQKAELLDAHFKNDSDNVCMICFEPVNEGMNVCMCIRCMKYLGHYGCYTNDGISADEVCPFCRGRFMDD